MRKIQIISYYPEWVWFKYKDWGNWYGDILDYSIVVGFWEFRVWKNNPNKDE